MIELQMECEDKTILMDVLKEKINDLHQEIACTERSEYRKMLKTRLARIKDILDQINRIEEKPLAV